MDILADYAAIAVGTAQATASRLFARGRAGAARISALGLPAGVPSLTVPRIDPAGLVQHGRDAISDAHAGVRTALGRLADREHA